MGDKSGCIVFSGGTAFNYYVDMFQSISPRTCYVLPVSDDGGSTAEIVRFLGGPAIGDLRSRIVRLARNESKQDKAILELLCFRLPNSRQAAVKEWESILHLRHPLWNDISVPMAHTILAFLAHFQKEMSDRIMARRPSLDSTNLESQQFFNKTGVSMGESANNSSLSLRTDLTGSLSFASGLSGGSFTMDNLTSDRFDFRHGSIGNFLITGCRLFFKSLDAAIFQIMALLGCPKNTMVIPIITGISKKKVKRYPSNRVRQIYQLYSKIQPICEFDPSNPTFGTPELDDSITILAALLRNGDRIIGQCEISHPGAVVSAQAPTVRKSSLYARSPVGYTAIYDRIKKMFSPGLIFSAFSSIPALASPLSSRDELKKSSRNGSQDSEKDGLQDGSAEALSDGEEEEADVSVKDTQKGSKFKRVSIDQAADSGLLGANQKHSPILLVPPHVSSTVSLDSMVSGSTVDSDSAVPETPPVDAREYLSINTPRARDTDAAKQQPLKSQQEASLKSNPDTTNVRPGDNGNIFFNKDQTTPRKLPAPIRRVYYSDQEGNEVLPRLNPLLPEFLSQNRDIIYGCGSLYTSLVPSLIVEGVGASMAPQSSDGDVRRKILLLNTTLDRETMGYNALDFVYAVTDALNYSIWAGERFEGTGSSPTIPSPEEFDGDEIGPDWMPPAGRQESGKAAESRNAFAEAMRSRYDKKSGAGGVLDSQGRSYKGSPNRPCDYITHLVYLAHGEISVDEDAVRELSITPIKLGNPDNPSGVYNLTELKETLLSLFQ